MSTFEDSRVRRTRVRRVLAFAGMVTAVTSLVWTRAALTPAPQQALGSSGLAVQAGSSGSSAGSGTAHRLRRQARPAVQRGTSE